MKTLMAILRGQHLMFNLFKKKVEKKRFTPSLPLTWWIDDLTHEVCGLVDDPDRGLSNMSWPDCDKVYLAVNKEAYDQAIKDLKYFFDWIDLGVEPSPDKRLPEMMEEVRNRYFIRNPRKHERGEV